MRPDAASVHAGAHVLEGLVGGVDADEPEARVLEVDDHVDRDGEVEADLAADVHAAPLGKYTAYNIRVCRPYFVRDEEGPIDYRGIEWLDTRL